MAKLMLDCKAITRGNTATTLLPPTSAIFVITLKELKCLRICAWKKIGAFSGELTK